MIAWIKHFLWFIKESYFFMQGSRKLTFWIMLIPLSIHHANFMDKLNKMTVEQRAEWCWFSDHSLERWYMF